MLDEEKTKARVSLFVIFLRDILSYVAEWNGQKHVVIESTVHTF